MTLNRAETNTCPASFHVFNHQNFVSLNYGCKPLLKLTHERTQKQITTAWNLVKAGEKFKTVMLHLAQEVNVKVNSQVIHPSQCKHLH